METLAGLRGAMYARFSSAKQRDTSIEDQIHLCQDFLSRNQGSVAKELILHDHAVSGTVVAREGFDRLLSLVEAKAIDFVITESGDRLSRDLGDSDRLWKLCEFKRVRVILVSDGIDSARDGSRTAFRFKAVMADEYIQDLAKKTLRGLRGQHGRGFSTGGLPYGYRSVPIWKGGKPSFSCFTLPQLRHRTRRTSSSRKMRRSPHARSRTRRVRRSYQVRCTRPQAPQAVFFGVGAAR